MFYHEIVILILNLYLIRAGIQVIRNLQKILIEARVQSSRTENARMTHSSEVNSS